VVSMLNQRKGRFGLVVTGEAKEWQSVLERIVGPKWLATLGVSSGDELLDVVESGLADAAVLDEEVHKDLDVLQLLRLIHQMNRSFPVVVLTCRRDRRWMETALYLSAFSVVIKPLELESLLRQVQRIMTRLDEMLRFGPGETS